jgi:hypothetical protein
VRDYELGLKWQPYKAFEFTATWVIADRTFEDRHLKQQATRESIEISSVQFLEIYIL